MNIKTHSQINTWNIISNDNMRGRTSGESYKSKDVHRIKP
jgi:hypothetical protein